MTKKHQLLAALAVSTVALTQASLASADEVNMTGTLTEVLTVTETQPIDPSTPIVPPAPTDPTKPPTTPDVPANPGTGGDTTKPPTNPDVPANPGTGGDTTTPPTTPDVPAGPGAGGDTTTPPTTPDVPAGPGTGGDTTTPPTTPTPPITDDAVNKDDQGNITVKPQVVAPNQTVVGTQNGQLLVQDASGNTRLAEASEFGGQKNGNGTVSFKTANGEMVTLPETGSTNGTLLSLLGTGLLGLVGLFWKKKTLKN